MVDTNGMNVAPQVLEQVQEYVAEHCPDLADGEYSVQSRKSHTFSDETLDKLRQDTPREAQPPTQVRESRTAYVVAPAPAYYPNGRTAVSPAPPAPPAAHYTITLRKDVRTDSGAILPRIARFVVDGSGHILRATASKLSWLVHYDHASSFLPHPAGGFLFPGLRGKRPTASFPVRLPLVISSTMWYYLAEGIAPACSLFYIPLFHLLHPAIYNLQSAIRGLLL